MLFFPFLNICHLQVIAVIFGYLVMDVDNDQGADSIGGWQVADGGAVIIPMGGRIKLGTVLICGQVIGSGNKSMLFIGEFLANLDIPLYTVTCPCRFEGGIAKAGPDWLDWFKGMGQIGSDRCIWHP